ncbi:MAG: DUF3107 domain-containing protein [Actinomycetota bacterium]|nr:DUF3107 domain-containing protein [Actinomycetota bacterium]
MIEVRMGVVDASKELQLELDEDLDAFRKRIEDALGSSGFLWMDDGKGKHFGVVANQVTYVEVDTASARSVGFAP